ncbi:beta-lactamase [Leucobacter sp. UCD-THU]|uniref:Class A beta-lactamase-related serine hydrolase n=1 Tax=Leucobacter muris TaxID=1935379 RepID=A0ABX5QI38_9MICO|nr:MULTISPECIES: serine hydrolase domain-containing protein [Leucobacter]EYT55251.1 beta-lactamase [Leucobacter sp. UCD-THU]QAB18769.1 class A beta-lactamase-related serine hydrolase [Leucobacter muris]
MIPRLAQRSRFAAIALIATAALGLTACTGGSAASPSGDVATLDQGLSAGIDEAIATAMQQSGSTEAVVGVWSGENAYVRGYGDGVDGKTLIRGAQATQPVMCALLLDLVEDGTVKLGRLVEKDLTRQSGLDEVTYGQLCEMTSGIADYKAGLADIFVNNPTRPWPEQELIAQGLTDSPLPWPGLDVNVSDTNALILSRALHVKTGDDISELLKSRVFEPAGMGSSYYPALTSTTIGGDTLAGLAYPSNGGAPVCEAGAVEKPEVSPSMLGGAGGTVTTVTDLKNFYEHYLDGAFGGEAAQQVTQTAPLQNPERDAEGTPTGEPDEAGPQWAFGMDKVGPLYGRSGAITGTLTAAYHDPESGFSVVVALNNSSAGAGFVKTLAFELAALSSEAGAGPELPWTAADQAGLLAQAAICQAAPEAEAAE